MVRLLKYFLVITILFSVAWAQDAVVVETNPRDPIVGEPFQILFKCQTVGNSEPEINFTPEGFSVLGRQVQGLSTRTVYQNGKITTTREILVSYDAKAEKKGIIHLRDVVVTIDGKTIREPSVSIQVADAPPEPKLIFLAAEVPQKTAYVGEGITVRYYLYKKTSLQAFDIKKYPKLDGFMKRYLQENENTQRVTVNGEMFGRSTIYSARLYPEKAGKLVVDPMDISATYAQDLFGNMGFGFGLGMRDLKTKTFSSEPVVIDVKPLPEAGKPKSFTGLVGKHQFDLKVGRTQLIVNEPLEVRLTVSGPGNLENMESPDIWNVTQLEKFDAKSDLNLVSGDSAMKSFDYTYLGKRGGEIPASEAEFSYFDPETGRYSVEKKALPGLVIVGNGKPTESPEPKAAQAPAEEDPEEPKTEGPTFVLSQSWLANPTLWLGLLVVGLLGVAVWKGKDYLKPGQLLARSTGDFSSLQRGKFGSAELVRVLNELKPHSTAATRQIVNESTLSAEAQQYFVQLLDSVEAAEYRQAGQKQQFTVDKKMLKALKKAITRVS